MKNENLNNLDLENFFKDDKDIKATLNSFGYSKVFQFEYQKQL